MTRTTGDPHILDIYPFIKTNHPKYVMQEIEKQIDEVNGPKCNQLTDPQPPKQPPIRPNQ
jgi:hypothetical protein